MDDGPEDFEAVGGADFFSFTVEARFVVNSRFLEPIAEPQAFANQFVIKFEAGCFDGDFAGDIAGKGFVAALVVGDFLAVEEIGEGDDENIADVVRKKGIAVFANLGPW